MRNILLIPKVKIHNANALSSPYTIGFPAMTAWLGAMHVLQRHLTQEEEYEDIVFKSIGVVCHDFDLQTHKGENDYVHSLIGTGNPLDKNGKRPSFIEEARIHLTVSLLIEVEDLGLIDLDEFKETVDHCLFGKMKLAAGDILPSSSNAELHEIDGNAQERALLRRVMPGHCLVERRDLMTQSMVEGQDGIDALLDYLKVTHESEQDENEKVTWKSTRKAKGWLVPVATGFHGISELGQAIQQRDANTPHRFAESIITLGEFVMPYRLAELDEMLWHYHANEENNLYLCQQNKQTNQL